MALKITTRDRKAVRFCDLKPGAIFREQTDNQSLVLLKLGTGAGTKVNAIAIHDGSCRHKDHDSLVIELDAELITYG